jgi:hypothetical protein
MWQLHGVLHPPVQANCRKRWGSALYWWGAGLLNSAAVRVQRFCEGAAMAMLTGMLWLGGSMHWMVCALHLSGPVAVATQTPRTACVLALRPA